MSKTFPDDYGVATSADAAADLLLIYDLSSDTLKGISRDSLLSVTGTPVDTSTVQSLTNKILDVTNTVTLKDTLFTLQDDGDVTKQARFQLSGITTGTIRTYTLPNASSTLMDLATAQTVTGVKTLTAPIISGGSIDNTTITVDSIGEHTAAAGVTIDGVLLKDGTVVSPTITGATITSSASTNETLTTPIVEQPVMRSWNGWQDANDDWAYASATTITVLTGATSKYAKGDKITLVQAATTKYFYVVGVAATTLTITGGSDYTLTNDAITNNYYSHDANPVGFPDWFAYTATLVGFSSTTINQTRFKIVGRSVILNVYISGTSNATSTTLTLPVTSITLANYNSNVMIHAIDNGTAAATVDYSTILSNDTIADLAHNDNNAGWTASGTKAVLFCQIYEF